MPKYAIVLCALALVLAVYGCASFKERSKKVGQTIADGTYNTYKAIEKADNWFKENYW